MTSAAQRLSVRIRRGVLEQSKRAGVGHVGSALSVADLLAAIFGGVLRVESDTDPDRDRFILAKGHAALGYTRDVFDLAPCQAGGRSSDGTCTRSTAMTWTL